MTEEIGHPIETSTPSYESTVSSSLTKEIATTCFISFSEKEASDIFLKATVRDENDSKFEQAKRDEIDKLVKMGICKFVPETEISKTGPMLHSRFVFKIKNYGESNECFKPRFVIL